jgi:hypothetical protein
MRRVGAWRGPCSRRVVRGVRLGAVALVSAAAASSCASNYEYVGGSAASDGAFFKIPKGWETFTIENDAATPEGRPAAITRAQTQPWTIVFDADPQPTLDHASEVATAHPFGVATVLPLPRAQRDQVSLRSLRMLATEDSTDPIEAHGDGTYEVVKYQDVSGSGGLVGERLVFNKQVEPGVWLTTDHTAMWNPEEGVIYRFVVRCASECFEDYQQQIDEVVESWQVRR